MPGEFEDEVVSGVVREGEETTTGTEVVEVEVVTTEAVVGVDKEEVTAGAAAFCTTLEAWYRAARWRFFSLCAGPRWCGFTVAGGGGGKVGIG